MSIQNTASTGEVIKQFHPPPGAAGIQLRACQHGAGTCIKPPLNISKLPVE
ncbi:unnamed protein product [Tuber melanosporum]|uniref:(Perigord truffle) hypothetical protein n=1 Tax=Tuber melanosporum (strain Mel28) TaxID=656061 RepID=D5GM97_TUBMM|nr:uncharacterized protein GSTUM_00010598001 [Tuber melanosporum]CAZ85634.1 unnamed protein product [Tuber melanosporum]